MENYIGIVNISILNIIYVVYCYGSCPLVNTMRDSNFRRRVGPIDNDSGWYRVMCQVGFAFPPDYKYRNDSDDANNKLSLIALFIAIISRRNGGHFINDIEWLLLSWIRPLSVRRATWSIISQDFHSGRERHMRIHTHLHTSYNSYNIHIWTELWFYIFLYRRVPIYWIITTYYLKSKKKNI